MSDLLSDRVGDFAAATRGVEALPPTVKAAYTEVLGAFVDASHFLTTGDEREASFKLATLARRARRLAERLAA